MTEEIYKKMYIAVLDEVPDYMVPTLVAHSVLGAHLKYFSGECEAEDFSAYNYYYDWLNNSFRKVVLRVNRKEFDKIQNTQECYAGYENTTLNGEKSCLVVLPVDSDKVPNVLKYSKLWKPKEN